ncbi:DUF4145 domain-containing protein [Quisquiliibacterium transsilvanicum]|uniref:DUF4145 domain-containing protein n=1 Tax=Quisquiliibacterium transsilvanicum TaxID=1549638 RepID=A0A7W8HKV7_9BURK|nr:DUF4145 domain-containing protein [Quisquiliibacterium transsilvanicum]MBB5273920.1 hypothetical protein [Quisquiliibacterium transsilvanicum]
MKIGDKIPLHCERCKKSTEHAVLYIDQRDETQSDESGQWLLEHTLTRGFTECVVCSWPKVRIHVFTLPTEQESYRSIPREPERPVPAWAKRLPTDVQQLLLEVYGAFTDKRYWLVVMGCRTLVDMFALERIGDVGGFAQKLEKLQNEGYLSSHDKLLIKQAVEVGHGATHRREAPSERECLAVLEITEHLIHKLALASHAETLNLAAATKAKTASRKPPR